jgi:hypothetical protein
VLAYLPASLSDGGGLNVAPCAGCLCDGCGLDIAPSAGCLGGGDVLSGGGRSASLILPA